jgi:hypothetical protein
LKAFEIEKITTYLSGDTSTTMKKILFKTLAAINRTILPSMSKKDLTKLSTLQKGLVAYRYWVTTNALD